MAWSWSLAGRLNSLAETLTPGFLRPATRWAKRYVPWIAVGAIAYGVIANNLDRLLLTAIGWLGEAREVTHWEEIFGLAAVGMAVVWGSMTVVRTREREAARAAERVAVERVRMANVLEGISERNAQLVEQQVDRIADRMSVLAARWAARTPPDWDLMAEKLIALQARQHKLYVWIDELSTAIPHPLAMSREDAYAAWDTWLREVLLDLADMFGVDEQGHSIVNDVALMLPLEDEEWLRISRGSWVNAQSIETGLFRKFSPGVSLAESGLTGAAFGERRMVHIRGVHESEYHMPRRCRGCFYQEIMVVPVGSEDPPLGVLSIASIQHDAFDENIDTYILAAYAGVVAYGLRYMRRLGVRPAELVHAAPLATSA